jgi:hypothetical protein
MVFIKICRCRAATAVAVAAAAAPPWTSLNRTINVLFDFDHFAYTAFEIEQPYIILGTNRWLYWLSWKGK